MLPTHASIIDLLSFLNLDYKKELLDFSNTQINLKMHLLKD